MRKALFVLLALVSFAFMSCDSDPYVVGQVKTVSELIDALKDESKVEIDIKAGTYSFDGDLEIGRDIRLFVEGGKAVLSFPEGKGVVATEKLGDGDLTISDIDIDGKLVINGGGSNSIHLENVMVSEVEVSKKEGEPPRLVIEGNTEIEQLNIIKEAIITVRTDFAEPPIKNTNIGEDVTIILEGAPTTALGEIKGDGKDNVFCPLWDGETIDVDWYSEGNDEFEIKTASQLAGLASLVNNGNDFSGKTIKLLIDIDLDNKEWTPIGKAIIPFDESVKDVYFAKDDAFKAFAGTFDGNGHTIYNLFFDNFDNTSGVDVNLNYFDSFKGLFGAIKVGSTIKNLNIENINLKGDSFNAAFVGYIPSSTSNSNSTQKSAKLENLNLIGKAEFNVVSNTAGIVGRNETGAPIEIIDCTVKVEDGSYIKNVADDSNWTDFFGGVIGVAYSKSNVISSCVVENFDIIANIEAAGGIAGGIAKGQINNCIVKDMTISIKNSEGFDGIALGAFAGVVIAKPAEENVLDLDQSKASNIILGKPLGSKNIESFSKLVGTYRDDTYQENNVTNALVNYEGIDVSDSKIRFE